MVKNQIVTVTIEDIGNDGEGIGKVEGYTLFVKGAIIGDVAKVKVLKAKKTYGYAKVEELITPSPDRVTPRCAVSGRCGGCQMQHLSYEKQLAHKADKVKNCLQRIGGLSEEHLAEVMEPIIGMDEPFHYRNKAQYPVGIGRDGKPVMGFYAGHSHNIIDCADCAIQEPVNAVILPVVKAFIEEYGVSAYDEEKGTGLLRHVLTRVGFHTKEVMVCLIINGKKFPKAEILAERVKTAVEEFGLNADTSCRYTLKSFCLNVNTAKTNVILGNEILPVYGETYITDYIGDIKYQISPLSFYQVNPEQTVKLYNKALEYADLSGGETVWDLYCGIGTISLFLAQKAGQVYGVEIVPQAIEDAKKNAVLNGMTNAEFFAGAAEDVMPAKYRESKGSMRADVICVDPPRKGCEESLLDTIVAMEPERIVYVSCDPATLARDVKYLGEKGYLVKKVCPVDQFAHTGHVETVVLLGNQKTKPDSHIKLSVDMDEFNKVKNGEK
ncbi:MAG: 23S rRNA (uracil(1939)-C(5))-methyltransferase RlmD [Lachnospiraceae bacterium]|nr:23S rRNA (uracil(1939)-C(5))-methyltransferase RlmD [Lachnospiraceae bacterium]